MKKNMKGPADFVKSAAFFLMAITAIIGCKKNDDSIPVPVISHSYTQVNLVSSNGSFAGSRTDTNLVNGWGIAFGSTGTAWISSQGKNVSVIYDQTGAQKLAPVSIPSSAGAGGGSPTGQIFNSTTDFVLSNGSAAKFIFAGTGGIISGWSSGTAALKAVDRSATSVYTGLASGSNGGNNYLYAADFKSAKIDVFDKNFSIVSMPFTDPSLPAGYSPFNIQNVSGKLFVTYAQVNATTHEEEKGNGLGYVDMYNTDGSFVKRFASQGALNAPWGVTQAPVNYLGTGDSAVVLIGNFGDGRINAFGNDGTYLGNLQSNGKTIVVDGLWGISFAPATATTVDPTWLFFAAGPADETQGAFGYIKK